MKNTVLLIAFAMILLTYGCGNSGSGSAPAPPADLAGFSVADFPNSNMQKALRMDATGKVIEEGEILDGKKSGTWITYHTNTDNIIAETVTNFVDGKRNGIWMRIGTNNRVEAYGYYADDQKDGRWTTYNYSRREKEEDYKNGKLHGFRRTFYKSGKDGQIKEEIEYKDGIQDGIYRYYLEDGTVSIDYVYKNGEIVERKKQG